MRAARIEPWLKHTNSFTSELYTNLMAKLLAPFGAGCCLAFKPVQVGLGCADGNLNFATMVFGHRGCCPSSFQFCLGRC